MPLLGRAYIGSSNPHEFYSVCRKCEQLARLSSRDAFAFFAVLFIPLIPLGSRRVLEHCSRCGKQRAEPLAAWRARANSAMAAIVAAYRANPRDGESVRNFVGACGAYQDRHTFLELAPEILGTFRSDPRIIRLIARVYASMGHPQEAEEAVRNAIHISDNNDARESLAEYLMQQDRPAEAAEYLSHLYHQPVSGNVGFLLMLAESFQAVGDHRRALETLNTLIAAEPGYASDKALQEIKRLAEHNLTSGKRIKSARIAAMQVPNLEVNRR